MEGDGWETVDVSCEACNGIAVGFVRVPEHVHPDQRYVVCGDCGDFICSVLADVEYIRWMDETARKSL